MTERQIDSRVKKLEELEAQAAEIGKQIDSLRRDIQNEIGDRETVETGRYIIRWTYSFPERFDSRRFRGEHGDIYKQYLTSSISRRFSYAAK